MDRTARRHTYAYLEAPLFRAALAAVSLAIVSLAAPSIAAAATYTGHGDTDGQMHTRKQDCCDAAIYAAQENSIALCRRAGGFAEAPRGVASGRCKWERRQSNSGTTYWRCSATASVRCR